MAAQWNDGYVIDVPYIDSFAVDLNPAMFSLAAVLHGQPPLDRTRTVVWAELGSGTGTTAAMVAAANDDVEVWGCDLNPAHVERSRTLAARAGLGNCTFDEASFEHVASDERIGPPVVDVVVVHGVYSWVSVDNQRCIAEFVRRRLRPGGLVYLSYEVATGWASMAPLAEAMRLHAMAGGRRSDVAFQDAAAAMKRLADGGARCFPLGPQEAAQFASLGDADPRYGAHEYLGSHFRPVMFDEVAATMAAARCSYVGSLPATDHMAGLWVPPELAELVVGTADVTLRQLLRDLIVQRPLRRDLFRRGLAEPTDAEREQWLRDIRVVGLGKALTAAASVGVPVGEVTLDPDFYGPLVGALGEGPLDVAGVQAIHPALRVTDAVDALSLLVNGGYAAPAVPAHDRAGSGAAGNGAAARRLNRVLIDENRRGADHRWLIAPAIGAAVASEYVEMLAVAAAWEGATADRATLTAHALADLGRLHRVVREDGALVTDPARGRAVVEARVESALEKMAGVLARLGVC